MSFESLLNRVNEAVTVASVQEEVRIALENEDPKSFTSKIDWKTSFFFFLFSDGAVFQCHDEHAAEARHGGVSLNQLLQSGVIRGGFYGIEHALMYLEVHPDVNITQNQLDAIEQGISLFHDSEDVCSVEFSGKSYYNLPGPVEWSELRSILLGHGEIVSKWRR